jgi:hypothetical protein
MHILIDPYWWTFALASLVQLVIFVRWFYRRIRNDELNSAFIRDMATSHLPQIYELLEKLCEQQGIAQTQKTPIRWVDLGNRRH